MVNKSSRKMTKVTMAKISGWLSVIVLSIIACSDSGVTKPEPAIRLVGTCDIQGEARNIFVADSFAYIAEWDSGLKIVDISNPAQPRLTASYDSAQYLLDVFVSGDYAYAVGRHGFEIINVSNIDSLWQVGNCGTPNIAWGIFVNGDYAYVACYTAGLQIIDFADPTNPRSVGVYDTPGTAFDVFVAGDYAYVADGSSGIQVVDISIPDSMRLVASYDTPGDAYDILIKDNYAYLADFGDGFCIINISNPIEPELTAQYDLLLAYNVFLHGRYVYVANILSMELIDIAWPWSSKRFKSIDTPGEALDVFVAGDYIYVADGRAGLSVFEVILD